MNDESDPEIWGVPMSKWPVDELLSLPWHAVAHLTDDDKRRIVERAVVEELMKGGAK